MMLAAVAAGVGVIEPWRPVTVVKVAQGVNPPGSTDMRI